jgi:hypothetical protein
MMDDKLIFSEDQAITATASSTDIIDTGVGRDFWDTAVRSDFGNTGNIFINIHCTVTFATLTSLTVSLQHCATEGGSYTALLTYEAVAAASLVAGFKWPRVSLPTKHLRFLKLVYTVTGDNATAGKVTAFLGEPI